MASLPSQIKKLTAAPRIPKAKVVVGTYSALLAMDEEQQRAAILQLLKTMPRGNGFGAGHAFFEEMLANCGPDQVIDALTRFVRNAHQPDLTPGENQQLKHTNVNPVYSRREFLKTVGNGTYHLVLAAVAASMAVDMTDSVITPSPNVVQPSTPLPSDSGPMRAWLKENFPRFNALQMRVTEGSVPKSVEILALVEAANAFYERQNYNEKLLEVASVAEILAESIQLRSRDVRKPQPTTTTTAQPTFEAFQQRNEAEQKQHFTKILKSIPQLPEYAAGKTLFTHIVNHCGADQVIAILKRYVTNAKAPYLRPGEEYIVRQSKGDWLHSSRARRETAAQAFRTGAWLVAASNVVVEVGDSILGATPSPEKPKTGTSATKDTTTREEFLRGWWQKISPQTEAFQREVTGTDFTDEATLVGILYGASRFLRYQDHQAKLREVAMAAEYLCDGLSMTTRAVGQQISR